MDNENEIIEQQLEFTKSEFLPARFDDPDGMVDVYSLDDEYAKTKKNKQVLLYSIVAFFLTAVVIFAFVMTYFIQTSARQSAIDISDFSDMDIQEKISENRRIEMQIQNLESEIAEYKRELRDSLARLNADYRRLIDSVNARELEDEERADELREVERTHANNVAATRSNFYERIESREAEIEDLRTQLAENREVIGEREDTEAILSSSDILQSIEMNRVKEYYEDRMTRQAEQHRRDIEELERRYNPVFAEQDLLSIINRPARRILRPDTPLEGVENDLLSEKVTDIENIESLRKNVEMQLAIIRRMQRIPYKNSVQRSLLHLETLANSILVEYDKMVLDYAKITRRNNLQISTFSHAFDTKITNERETGYVLDARNSSQIGVFTNKIYNVEPGSTALVFRQDDEFIATIRFKYVQGMLFAETVSVEPGKSIQPFDKILIRLM